MKKPFSPRKLKQKTTGKTMNVKVQKDTKNHKELKNKKANKKKQKTKNKSEPKHPENCKKLKT